MRASPDRAGASPSALGLSPALQRSGFNAAGVLSAADYDARVPDGWQTRDLLPAARSVVVLATGGRDFFEAFRSSASVSARSAGPPPPDERDPLDAFTRRVAEEAARHERSAGGEAAAAFYFESRLGRAGGTPRFADFVGLAAAAGLGAPSRLAILIHPEFGPWIAIRALLLLSRALAPSRPDPGFAPCTGCPAPCQAACPGGAVGVGGFDLARCVATTAREPGCRVGCAARRACVVGPEHRYSAEAEAYHRRAAWASAEPASGRADPRRP